VGEGLFFSEKIAGRVIAGPENVIRGTQHIEGGHAIKTFIAGIRLAVENVQDEQSQAGAGGQEEHLAVGRGTFGFSRRCQWKSSSE
jgi:hypothetical protein